MTGPLLIVLVSLLTGCQSVGSLLQRQDQRIKDLEGELGTLSDDRTKLVREHANQREAALRGLYDADMQRAENAANYIYAAQRANADNPQPNRETQLVGHFTDVALAASPKPPTAEFKADLLVRLPKLEDPKLSDKELVAILHKDFDEVIKANLVSVAKQNDVNSLASTQRDQLQTIDDKIASKQKDVVDAHRNMTQATLRELAKAQDTAKLYSQLVWLFGGCAALAGIGAGVCLYLGNPRMAIYAGVAAGAFVGCCFLTLWLHENRWVLWVIFGGGMICAAGTFIVRYGWQVRDTQLKTIAASRSELERLFKLKGRTLQSFRFPADTTLNDLDVHELEDLCERLRKLPDTEFHLETDQEVPRRSAPVRQSVN